jgi:hypothetical protein
MPLKDASVYLAQLETLAGTLVPPNPAAIAFYSAFITVQLTMLHDATVSPVGPVPMSNSGGPVVGAGILV